MRQWTGSAFVKVMACRLFGAQPLPEPMRVYCQLDSWDQISVKFESEFYHFYSMHFKLSSAKMVPILSRERWVNSPRPRDAYMRQSTNNHWFRQWLVAWPVPRHYLKQWWNIVNLTLGNKFQWNLNRNSFIFTQENAFENVVWKMTAILSLWFQSVGVVKLSFLYVRTSPTGLCFNVHMSFYQYRKSHCGDKTVLI